MITWIIENLLEGWPTATYLSGNLISTGFEQIHYGYLRTHLLLIWAPSSSYPSYSLVPHCCRRHLYCVRLLRYCILSSQGSRTQGWSAVSLEYVNFTGGVDNFSDSVFQVKSSVKTCGRAPHYFRRHTVDSEITHSSSCRL